MHFRTAQHRRPTANHRLAKHEQRVATQHNTSQHDATQRVTTLRNTTRYLTRMICLMHLLVTIPTEMITAHVFYRYGSLNPLSFIGGIQMYTGPRMASSNTRGDFENYIARLHAVQKQVFKYVCLLRKVIDSYPFVNPSFSPSVVRPLENSNGICLGTCVSFNISSCVLLFLL